jgi:hypothetical protein
MARGWESKAVEDQVADALSARDAPLEPQPTPLEQELRRRREVLLLSRTHALQSLQQACHPHHRALLERAIEEIDRQLNDT